jgi:lysophospholipase L1-like esterase
MAFRFGALRRKAGARGLARVKRNVNPRDGTMLGGAAAGVLARFSRGTLEDPAVLARRRLWSCCMSRPRVGRLSAALLSLATVIALSAAPARAGDAVDACSVPDELIGFTAGLERTRARIAGGGQAVILAIGSSSTEGVGATDADHTYPARLAVHLAARVPVAAVRVVNRGIGGEVVATTAARLRTEVAAVRPDLVIWQVGTNDAVRGVGLDTMAALVEDGLDWLEAEGVDAVLMDPQFYPRIADNAGYRQAVTVIADLAARHGVPLVRRFEAMRYWAGRPQPVSMLSRDAFHMNDQGYECIAGMIAGSLAARWTEAAGPATRPAGAGTVAVSATAGAKSAATAASTSPADVTAARIPAVPRAPAEAEAASRAYAHLHDAVGQREERLVLLQHTRARLFCVELLVDGLYELGHVLARGERHVQKRANGSVIAGHLH